MGNIGYDVPHRWQGGHLNDDGFLPARICNQLAMLHHRERAGSNWLVSEIDSLLFPVYRPILMPCDVRKLADICARPN
jgi:hypothetical protein